MFNGSSSSGKPRPSFFIFMGGIAGSNPEGGFPDIETVNQRVYHGAHTLQYIV